MLDEQGEGVAGRLVSTVDTRIGRGLDDDAPAVAGTPSARSLHETLGPGLHELYLAHERQEAAARDNLLPQPALTSSSHLVLGDRVVVSFRAADGDADALLQALAPLGFEGSAYGGGVSGHLPIAALGALDGVEGIAGSRPTIAETRVGSATSQADVGHNADDARATFGVDGTGITIGVLSDSFDTSPTAAGSAAMDVASGDLPNDIVVLQDLPASGNGIDEGRAMMQLIHDLAPGADLLFRTAFLGAEDFAAGIVELADAGADIIVDDIGYLTQPQFQDGVIAQAVDDVAARGVAYFSSAGNSGTQAYESANFGPGVQAQLLEVNLPDGGTLIYELHDFDPGPAVDTRQRFSLEAGGSIRLALQWDDPYNAPRTDLDVFVVDPGSNQIRAGSFADNPSTGTAVEFLAFQNPFGTAAEFDLLIGQFDPFGQPETVADPGRVRYIDFDGGTSGAEFFNDAPTVFGHPRAEGGAGVGAAGYFNTPEFGQEPPLLQSFSSVGGIPILFDQNGNRLPTPETRQDVAFTAIDGTDTTFFGSPDFDNTGFPNFFGTSAAAPHAAAIAALMLEADPTLTPDEIFAILSETATDIGPSGVDAASGAGLIDAFRAVEAVAGPDNLPPSAADDGFNALEDSLLSVAAPGVLANDSDPDGDPLTVSLVAGPETGTLLPGAGGAFTYTPAANFNGSDKFTYRVSDLDGATATATVTISVAPVNDAPVAVADAATVLEDRTVTVPVLANDVDVDGDVLLTAAASDGANGTVELRPDGTVAYTPDDDFNGTDSFSYTVTDGNGRSDTGLVSVVIIPANDAPEAVPDEASTVEGVAVIVDVLANDDDVDGDTVRTTGAGDGANGTTVVNQDGTVTYTPAPGFSGADGFTYQVSDGRGGSATGSVAVEVIPAEDPPGDPSGDPPGDPADPPEPPEGPDEMPAGPPDDPGQPSDDPPEDAEEVPVDPPPEPPEVPGPTAENINLDGNVPRIADTNGGFDTYTVLPGLVGDVDLIDNDGGLINLPVGLEVEAFQFAQTGLRIETPSGSVTLLAAANDEVDAFQFRWGGTPLDPEAGVPLSFEGLAQAVGAPSPDTLGPFQVVTAPASGEIALVEDDIALI